MILKRSKEYVAVLLGGLPPVNVDKVIELIVDKSMNMHFIYGQRIFILYFRSKKSVDEMRDIFTTVLKDEVDVMFVFRNNKHIINHLPRDIRVKMEAALRDKGSVIDTDLKMLRRALSSFNAEMMAHMPHQPNVESSDDTQSSKTYDEAMSDNDIINELIMKMKDTGYESLSPAELDFLATYKNKYRKNDDDVD